MAMIITIDGPAGTGKSTVARLLAKKLGYHYLDTGALYRVITYRALKNKITADDAVRLTKLLKSIRILFKEGKASQEVLLNGKNLTREIRKPHITNNVYRFAELPLVRRAMLKIQRRIGKTHSIVGEGRDLGSVVFPDARIKFYLDATAKERALRRYKELKGKGIKDSYDKVLKEIKARDKRDTTRKLAPLRKAKGAIRVDTTRLSIQGVVAKLLKLTRESCDPNE
ncbi:MAG: (d)CMP kinase [Planctomycetes bacterium]|nr:(d)CMP kinase [Planctomycetota bacterium]